VSVIRRLSQRWHFARHIPLSQIAARFALVARRKWETRFSPVRYQAGSVGFCQPMPQPLFAPRAVSAWQTGQGLRFRFVGREIEMPDGIAWRMPVSDPATQLWRMNLHYMEWLEGLERDAGVAAIRSWIAGNPPYTSESWSDSWNSYALSLRVVCWLQFLARHHVDTANDIAGSLAEQLDFLMRHLETDIGGNHLIKNVKALLWGAASLDAPQSGAWMAKGKALLVAEVARQILPDGMHYERSPSYHAQVFADLIECHHALGDASRLTPLLEKMAGATAMLAHPDGGPAQFNDSGLTMAYVPTECLAIYAQVMGQATVRAQSLPDAGYHAFHGDSLTVIADGGLIGPNDLPAHAHGDIGSFELSAGPHRMIIDQGVFEYVDGSKRRKSRATASHNTVALGDHDQADFFGAFRCGKRPAQVDAKSEDKGTGHRLILQWPAAFDFQVKASRCFDFAGDQVTITDTIDRDAGLPVSSALLLHPACSITVNGTQAHVIRDGWALAISASHQLESEPAVWWPDMGVEVPTHRLRLTFPPGCRESALVITVLPPDKEPK
jgi:uncharacterized heparinase superfamily protein